MKLYATGALLAVVSLACAASVQPKGVSRSRLISLSREATVKISSGIEPMGTGFVIAPDLVATCFHVVAAMQVDGQKVTFQNFPNLRVKFADGAESDATCVSIPSQQEQEPILFDFAVLRLSTPPPSATGGSLGIGVLPGIGDDVVFSGYPLDAPFMLTHQGTVSGVSSDGEFIAVEAAVNKGNSGGLLLSSQAMPVGIMTLREGGLSKELARLRDLMMQLGPRLGGVSHSVPTEAGTIDVKENDLILQTVNALDRNISTGIGYARTTKHLREYVAKHFRP